VGVLLVIALLFVVVGALWLIRTGRKHQSIYRVEHEVEMEPEFDVESYIRSEFFKMRFKIVYVNDDGLITAEIRDKKTHQTVAFAVETAEGDISIREVKQQGSK
jgi:predicted membrane protein